MSGDATDVLTVPRRLAASTLGLMLVSLTLGPAQGPYGFQPDPHRGTLPMLTVSGAPADAVGMLQRIARILQVDLRLPLPARIFAHIYDGPQRFEQGLVADAAVPLVRAAALGRFAVGVALPGTLLLQAPPHAQEVAGDWPRLLAHELTHLAQIELAGRDRGPAQWLVEGMAEWVAYRVVDQLGLASFEDWTALARVAAATYVRKADGLDLDRLTRRDAFMAEHQRVGTLLTYRLVFHLAHSLVAEHGLQSLMEYFLAFRFSGDAARNFSTSFDMSVEAFERAALTTLASAAPRV